MEKALLVIMTIVCSIPPGFSIDVVWTLFFAQEVSTPKNAMKDDTEKYMLADPYRPGKDS